MAKARRQRMVKVVIQTTFLKKMMEHLVARNYSWFSLLIMLMIYKYG